LEPRIQDRPVGRSTLLVTALREARYGARYTARRVRECDMFLPEDRLTRHVPGQPAPPALHVPPRGLLPRHVTSQPAPPVLHVPPRGPANATCTRPADSASATCSSPRTGWCYMSPASRLRQCYMFLPEDPPPGGDENIAWRTPELAPLEPRIQDRPVGRVRILGSVWSRLPGRVTFTPFQIGA